MSNKLYLLTLLLAASLPAFAQDSLMSLLKGTGASTDHYFTIATFKSSRLINAQTTENTQRRCLEFRVAHRFGNFLDYHGDNNGGPHTFFGLDAGNFDIRIGFDYGLTDRLMIGISRSKREENIEGHAKLRLLRQTVDENMPISLSIYGSTSYTPKIDNEGYFTNSANRFNHVSQLILARKFSSSLSLEVIGSWVHRNVIINRFDDNEIYSVGGAGRWRFTRSFSLIADYFYNLRTEEMEYLYYNPLGAGVEIETGGHVFSLMFTNAQYIIEQEFIPYTSDTWTKNGWKFSFNISRTFAFKKKEAKEQ